ITTDSMSASATTVCLTDGVTKHLVVIRNDNNSVSDELLRALFQSDIVGLQCIDTNSNTELFNITRIDGHYNVFPEKHYIYKIIKVYKGTTSLTNIEQKLSDQVNRLHSQREKSLTPTDDTNRSESNKLLSIVDNKLADFALNIDNKLADFALNIDNKLADFALNIDNKLVDIGTK
ncbi:unnamed protein product, partial [Rotaria magnacalcarata]